MISRLGLLVSRAFQKTAPDPFVLAIGLTVLTAILALLFGEFDVEPGDSRLVAMLDAWRDPATGFWRFLGFGMQMCLILVTGHALASTRPIRRMIDALAAVPRSTATAALLVSFVACAAGLINWGLGLIVGALLAREVGRSLHRRGIVAHYPLLAAAGYTTMLLWHGGLSGTAPLTMSSINVAQGVLPTAVLERVMDTRSAAALEDGQLIGLGETIGSGLNLIVTGGLLLGVPLLVMLLAPKRREDMQPISAFDVPAATVDEQGDKPRTVPDRLDRSLTIACLLAVPLLLGLWRYVSKSGFGSITLNEVNALMFALGLFLHGSPKAYMDAATEGVRGCAGIIIQFPLYAGIMGIMQSAGLVEKLALAFAAIGNETTLPLLSFLAAGVVNLFVPSGGGQWAIQGPIALEAGLEAGVSPAKMIMAVAYGDQLTNMLQPFWALPLLGITGVKARDIVGYTTVIMLIAALWMALALLLW